MPVQRRKQHDDLLRYNDEGDLRLLRTFSPGIRRSRIWETTLAALVRLAVHVTDDDLPGLPDLPGQLLKLTGVANRRQPPRVSPAWIIESRAPTPPRLVALPNVVRAETLPTAEVADAPMTTSTKPMKSQVEIEWQLDANDLLGIETALLGRPSELEPRVAPGPVLTIEDRYFDTADLRLLRAGYACRLRSSDGDRELTLKATTTVKKGPQRRTERTQALASGEDLDAALSGGEVSDLIHLVVGGKPLIGLFQVATTRRIFQISIGNERVGEISLDRTTITPDGGGNPVRLRRVEVEASSDTQSIETLRTFVARLRKQHHLHWGRQSKFELGLQAGDWLGRSAIDLGPVEIRRDSSIGELTLAVIRRHLADLLYQEPATRLGEDSEALHAMRVANRRLRADLRLFEDVLPEGWHAIDEELRWLGGVLGSVRDLDIQLARIDGWIAENQTGELDGLAEIQARLNVRRLEARASLIRSLDGARYGDLVEHMRSALQGKDRSLARSGQLAAIAGAKLLIGLERRVRRGAAGLTPTSDPERFHDLRIDCKRFRYGLEAFAPLYGKPAERLIRRLTALQDLLGGHQDAMIAAAELESLSHDGSLPRSTVFTLGRLAERSLAEAAQRREAFPDAYRPIAGGDWTKLQRRLRHLASRAPEGGEATEDR